jgi:hypothetical protein
MTAATTSAGCPPARQLGALVRPFDDVPNAASGVTWLILGCYVPLLLVSLGLIVWQLATRRAEALAAESAQPAILREAMR